MREFLRWLLSQREVLKEKVQERTKDTARLRLQVVLMHDRLDLPPEKMEDMKREIWEVVSRYMVVEDDFMEFEVRRLDELMVLVSNIQVKELDRLAPAT
jgi:cell division topological specificity factor